MNRAAITAAIARPAKADHPQPGRDMIEHLAHCLADHMQHAATTRTGVVFYIEPDLFARQMCRKTRALGARYRFDRSAAVADGKPGFGLRYVGVQILEAQMQLIVIEALGATAELIALQLLDDQLEAFDLRLRLGESGPLGRKRSHHPVQRLNIVRQSGKIDVHDGRA